MELRALGKEVSEEKEVMGGLLEWGGARMDGEDAGGAGDC
jgi:hypothetical protein